MVNLGRQIPSFVPGCSIQDRLHMKSTTHLAKIAVILQDAPDKMLTFSQLIYRLTPLIPEGRKSVVSNIRVCLSSNKCFVKIPVIPGSQGSKKNYWKLDTHQITEKMVRRHFRGILELFPELASKLKTQIHHSSSSPSSSSEEERAPVCSPEPPAYSKAQVKSREVKFSSPFSIESILKMDSPRASPLSSVPFRDRGTKRSLTWDTLDHPSAGLSPVWSVGGSTHHGLGSPGAAGQYCSRSPHNSNFTYSAPSLVHSPYRSWL